MLKLNLRSMSQKLITTPATSSRQPISARQQQSLIDKLEINIHVNIIHTKQMHKKANFLISKLEQLQHDINRENQGHLQ
ncbi:hypothetical protein SS50377_20519 [Spironucleus salmonicida]|uniref:Uncharacterized protein n=1 Tax=Spironucleus salmonicida TaxID=348837 RepID=A0A9P8M056_9EUKA|nr:hypothetical protein SS50377_20519 [Spironucleus salmonicida]